MSQVGFKHNARRQSYYVDGHEEPKNVFYRKKYIEQYLKLEYICSCWITLNETNVKELEEKDKSF